MAADLAGSGDGLVSVGVRPEHLELVSSSDNGIAGEVTVVEELGSEAFLHVRTKHQGDDLTLVVRAAGETSTRRGDQVNVGFSGPTHVFGTDGERLGE